MKYITLITLLLNISTKAMVVDENNNNTLNTHIKTNLKTIGIFGTTPNYLRYHTFFDILKEQYTKLYKIKDLNEYDAKKSQEKFQKLNPSNELKQIFKKKLSTNFKTGLKNFSINMLSNEKLQEHAIDLFLNTAINKTIIEKNTAELYKTAAISAELLVHIFLPSYFRGSGDEKPENIYRFLVRSAAYYGTLYETARKKFPKINIPIFIVIPKISSIINKSVMAKDFDMLNSSQQNKILFDANIQTINETIITKLSPNVTYAFINHNTKQNEELIKLFNKKEQITSVGLQTFGGSAYKDFTPYDGKKFFIDKKVQQFFEIILEKDLEK